MGSGKAWDSYGKSWRPVAPAEDGERPLGWVEHHSTKLLTRPAVVSLTATAMASSAEAPSAGGWSAWGLRWETSPGELAAAWANRPLQRGGRSGWQ